MAAEARATLRFETPPGKQLQIDFGETRASVGEQVVKLHVFVCDPRLFAAVVRTIVQARTAIGLVCWPGSGLPAFWWSASRGSVGLTRVRWLTTTMRARARFALMLASRRLPCIGIFGRACAPYRARTKGKDERALAM
jgi:transposase